MALGAEKKDAYLLDNHNISGFGSIYKRYSLDDLYCMIEALFKESIKKYHVDLHNDSQDREFYEEKTKIINEAHQRALKILRGRGYQGF